MSFNGKLLLAKARPVFLSNITSAAGKLQRVHAFRGISGVIRRIQC